MTESVPVTKRKIADVVATLDASPSLERRKRIALSSNDLTASVPAAYRPWHLPDWLARLSTFKISLLVVLMSLMYIFVYIATWFGKPIELDAVKCSQHGWRNTAENTLQCPTCQARLHVPETPESNGASSLGT